MSMKVKNATTLDIALIVRAALGTRFELPRAKLSVVSLKKNGVKRVVLTGFDKKLKQVQRRFIVTVTEDLAVAARRGTYNIAIPLSQKRRPAKKKKPAGTTYKIEDASRRRARSLKL